MKNSNDTIWNRISDLLICSTVFKSTCQPKLIKNGLNLNIYVYACGLYINMRSSFAVTFPKQKLVKY